MFFTKEQLEELRELNKRSKGIGKIIQRFRDRNRFSEEEKKYLEDQKKYIDDQKREVQQNFMNDLKDVQLTFQIEKDKEIINNLIQKYSEGLKVNTEKLVNDKKYLEIQKRKFHTLKIIPRFFSPLVLGIKDFEVRINDRNYEVGDIITFAEYDPDLMDLTGNHVHKKIKYILFAEDFPNGLKSEFCVLGLSEVKNAKS